MLYAFTRTVEKRKNVKKTLEKNGYLNDAAAAEDFFEKTAAKRNFSDWESSMIWVARRQRKDEPLQCFTFYYTRRGDKILILKSL